MSYEASTIMSDHMRLPYTTDGTPLYSSITRPTPSTSPALNYTNPNGAVSEHDSMAVVTAAGVEATGSVTVKRKRGRPRKYSPDVSVSVSPAAAGAVTVVMAGQVGGEFSSPATVPAKKPRGRPPGSLNKQHPVALGSTGVGFMPHVLEVKTGEDVVAKMMWFSQNSTRALCVLSATGSVSNVTLRQSATSGGTVTYEGSFEILSLSGSFMVSEVGGQRSRTGGISVALSGPDGRVLGGNVAGPLTAASPVQVIVGSFVPASQNQTKTRVTGNNEAEVVNAPHSESSGAGLGSPYEQSNPQAMANMTWR